MEETPLQLLESASVTLQDDGTGLAGTGTIQQMGPVKPGERWEITSVATMCTSVKQSKVLIYRNGSQQFIDGSYSANQDTSDTSIKLQSGESLRFVYSNGDIGAIGSITIQGTRYLRGRRAY